jgi:predicted NUDIX family phosphoesterase
MDQANALREEELVVVTVDALRAAGLSQGFDPNPERILSAAFTPGVARSLRRSLAEADERFKQIVCYIALLYDCTVFHYRRSPRVGETRLAGLRSLGIGGHLNSFDTNVGDPRQVLERAIRRELAEEVWLDHDPELSVVGVINDDANPVGRVHVGLVATGRLRNDDVRLRDETLVDGRFDLLADVGRRVQEFETWSRLCLPAILRESSSGAPRPPGRW